MRSVVPSHRPLGLVAAVALAVALWHPAIAADAPRAAKAPSADAGVSCVSCHAPGYGLSGHGRPAADGCATCHAASETGGRDERLASDHPAVAPGDPEACRTCHADTRGAGHPEVAAGRCVTCHDPHEDRGRATPSWPERQAADCVQCHEPVDTARYTHTIVRRGQCSGCHDLHGPKAPGLLVGGSPNASCAGCHPEQSEPVPGESPRGAGACDACHDPHGSDLPAMLRMEQPALCATCHEPFVVPAEAHGAVRLGECTGCHEPHGPDHARDLATVATTGEMCFRCHADDATGRAVVHKPVAEGRCLDCHAAHGSDYPLGLVADASESCLSCHEDEDRRAVSHPHLTLSGSCTTCHDAHGTRDAFLLAGTVNALCVGCHPAASDGLHVSKAGFGGVHPVGPGPKDATRAGRELSCTSCHDAHGSENPNLFYRTADTQAVCRECHQSTFGDAPARRTIPRTKAPAPVADGAGAPPAGAAGPKAEPARSETDTREHPEER